MNWEYRAHRVYLKRTGRGRDAERTWTMTSFDEGDHSLESGLELLGQQGWELAGVQLSLMYALTEYSPESIYVFKRPVAEPA